MSTDAMTALSVAEAILLVIVLAIALTRVRQGLAGISSGLTALAGALATVESQHLRPLGGVVGQINARFATILSVLPGIAATVGVMLRAAPRTPFSSPITTTNDAMRTIAMIQRMSMV